MGRWSEGAQRWGVVVVVVAAAACAAAPGFQPLNRTALRASQPRTIAVATSPTPDLVLGGPTRIVFGSSNGVAQIVENINAASRASADGKAFQRRGEIGDPALAIRRTLADGLARRFSLQIVDAAADLILDVRTTLWGTKDYGNFNFGVAYEGTLRLTDVRSGQVLAEGVCTSHPISDGDSPSREQLLDRDGELLNAGLASLTQMCIDDYRKRVLGLY